MNKKSLTGVATLLCFMAGCPNVSRQPEPVSRNGGGAAQSASTDTESPSKVRAHSYRRVFPSQVAAPEGSGFYTSDADDLREQLQGFLRRAQPSAELEGRDLLGFLSPHAGYRYSGPTAAYAYRQLEGRQVRTVVVMALSHRQRSSKVALLDHDAYRTPLGPVRIDTDLVKTLVDAHGELLEVNESVFQGEHSLEIQLPFLQLTLGDGFSLVPIILSTGDESHATRLAEVLFQQLGQRRDVLFVASSDLTHLYPYDEASTRDRDILSLVVGHDLAEYRQRGPMGREMPCGYFPLLALMELFGRYGESQRRATLLQYQNSGDTAGDRSRVVGYGAVAFSLDRDVRREDGASDARFSRDDRRALMDLAQRSVRDAVRGRTTRPARPGSTALVEPGAAFVTLKCGTDGSGRCVGRGDGLRGCIGHIIAQVPLYECVADVARSAAIHDRRFPPISEAELEHLSYEVSVLTPPEPVTDPSSIVVGRDGLIMSRGGHRGLLLPQVPGEHGWDRETFLDQTCRKAGLEYGCWRDSSTTIERFGAVVWGEDLVASDRH